LEKKYRLKLFENRVPRKTPESANEQNNILRSYLIFALRLI
jgi:hypothetical protein